MWLSHSSLQVVGSKLYWKHCVAAKVIHFDSTPFTTEVKHDLHCQFDIHYFGQRTSPTATKPAVQLSKKPPSEYSDQGEQDDISRQNEPSTEEDASRKSKPMKEKIKA